jgi:hypothetical protein
MLFQLLLPRSAFSRQVVWCFLLCSFCSRLLLLFGAFPSSIHILGFVFLSVSVKNVSDTEAKHWDQISLFLSLCNSPNPCLSLFSQYLPHLACPLVMCQELHKGKPISKENNLKKYDLWQKLSMFFLQFAEHLVTDYNQMCIIWLQTPTGEEAPTSLWLPITLSPI